jgi:hypothetical protein
MSSQLNLEGKWEVGLVEFRCDKSWYNLDKPGRLTLMFYRNDNKGKLTPKQYQEEDPETKRQENHVKYELKLSGGSTHVAKMGHLSNNHPATMSADQITADVSAGTYASPERLAELIEDSFNSQFSSKVEAVTNRQGVQIENIIRVRYDSISSRFVFRCGLKAHLITYPSEDLGIFLGLNDNKGGKGTNLFLVHELWWQGYSAKFAPEINNSKLIHLYSEIIELERVGSEMAHLLRVVVSTSSDTDGVYRTFDKPFYKRVCKQYIHDIDIKVCDDTGDEINLQSGSVSSLLHFRKVL